MYRRLSVVLLVLAAVLGLTAAEECDVLKLQDCVKDLSTIDSKPTNEEKCSTIIPAIVCVTKMKSACKDQPALLPSVEQLLSSVDFYYMYYDCESHNDGGIVVPSRDPTPMCDWTSFGKCSVPMAGLEYETNLEILCPKLLTGADCLEDLQDRCPEGEGDNITSTVVTTLNSINTIMTAYCKGYMTTTHRPTADPYKQCTVDKIDNCAWKVLYGNSSEAKCRNVKSAKDCFRRLDYNCDDPTQKHLGDVESRVNIMEAQCHMYGHDTGYGSQTGDGEHQGPSGVSTHHAMGILVFTLSIACAIFWN